MGLNLNEETLVSAYTRRVHASDGFPGAKALKSSILVFLSLLALSPVLRTLTASTSSDSIWALTASLLGLNVLLADYSPPRDARITKERFEELQSFPAEINLGSTF